MDVRHPLVREITKSLMSEGFTMMSDNPEEVEFLPVDVETVVARVLTLYAENKKDHIFAENYKAFVEETEKAQEILRDRHG